MYLIYRYTITKFVQSVRSRSGSLTEITITNLCCSPTPSPPSSAAEFTPL
ncbi:hypothetical protein HanXRQr2_Chr14g0659401 [Helianthus annuus]|uniref:Uncharacterized protein n=1 Tax=Helianthus annuus TaxID=4232 RepID=A0A9K3EC09_HELAN|nr:hypothetical protein HanXRQr2_Chr14g0659401 [Helianthus annuus]KAJ0841618.1 hypothetical protein HanPSC8_Chr14g0632471 [Helianthus annuus]